MIIGRGLLARAFEKQFATDRGVTIFASGVSNSNETSKDAFAREARLLEQALDSKTGHLVYFSTCSIGDHERQGTPYVQHKIRMEEMVRAAGGHLIFRLPQVVGHAPNPYTLTNYLYAQISSGRRFSVWMNAWRDIIDVDDIATLAGYMICNQEYWNRTLNIASPFAIRVIDLVRIYERILGVAANYEPVDSGDHYEIDVTEAMKVAKLLNLRFKEDYFEQVIRKYYGQTPGKN